MTAAALRSMSDEVRNPFIFCQNARRMAQLAHGDAPEPAVRLLQHVRLASRLDARTVSLHDRLAGDAPAHRDVVGEDRQVGAGREPHQILRPGEGGRLVEVVDPPDEPSVAVAPGPEVLEVKIAHRRDRRRAGDVAQLFSPRLPELAPAVERGAHEEERPQPHALVLGAQVGRARGGSSRPATLHSGGWRGECPPFTATLDQDGVIFFPLVTRSVGPVIAKPMASRSTAPSISTLAPS